METLYDRISAAVADRYVVERELGSGGMAVVFLARDTRHDRDVAIKVLRPELSAVIGADRFVREIQIAARLQHPHIVGLHDSGQADGLLFYVMPFVDGETLGDRLAREHTLAIDDAIRIGTEVADALGYAHDKGVVHRDIKPANILLTSGHIMVSDFGIARALSEAGGNSLTATGIALGTPDYMSPEQAAGDLQLDGRSDLYSLGIVLYEALTGAPPFRAETPHATIARRFAHTPPPISETRPSVPAGVDTAIGRVLALEPAERFATAVGFARALRSGGSATDAHARTNELRRPLVPYLPIVSIVLALLIGGAWYALRPGETVPPRVVVLPFTNVGPVENEYFADGVTEEMASRLAGISGLQVTSRTSALQYKGTTKTIGEIGRELRVDYVLEGTVRTERAPDGTGQVRVIPQLIRVADDVNLWSGRYDTSLVPGAVIATQASIAEQVAAALDVALAAGEREVLGQPPTLDAQAYDAYLLGRFHWNRRTPENIDRAISYFGDAIRRDSSFAAAWAGLADALVLLPFYGADGQVARDAFERAKLAARHAIDLAPDNAEAHASLGEALLYNDRDWDGAEQAFLRSIALDRNYPVSRYWYAELLAILHRYQEALIHARRAVELAPAAPIAHHLLGQTLMLVDDWLGAETQFEEALGLESDLRWSHLFLSVLALRDREWDRAHSELVLMGAPEHVADGVVSARRDPTRSQEAAAIIAAYASGSTDLPFSSIRRNLYGLADIVDSTVVWLVSGVEAGSGLDLLNMTHPIVGRAAADPRILDLRLELGLPN